MKTEKYNKDIDTNYGVPTNHSQIFETEEFNKQKTFRGTWNFEFGSIVIFAAKIYNDSWVMNLSYYWQGRCYNRRHRRKKAFTVKSLAYRAGQFASDLKQQLHLERCVRLNRVYIEVGNMMKEGLPNTEFIQFPSGGIISDEDHVLGGERGIPSRLTTRNAGATIQGMTDENWAVQITKDNVNELMMYRGKAIEWEYGFLHSGKEWKMNLMEGHRVIKMDEFRQIISVATEPVKILMHKGNIDLENMGMFNEKGIVKKCDCGIGGMCDCLPGEGIKG